LNTVLVKIQFFYHIHYTVLLIYDQSKKPAEIERLKKEKMEILQLQEDNMVNADVINTLADKVEKLSKEVQELKESIIIPLDIIQLWCW